MPLPLSFCNNDVLPLANQLGKNPLSKHAFRYNLTLSCKLLKFFNQSLGLSVSISSSYVSSEQKVKLLGINLESRLNFDYHVNMILNKGYKKYHALARICNYMNTNKRRVLMKAFIASQLSYCPLAWIFHSITKKNRINTLHEKALRLVYTSKTNLSFDDLLKVDKPVKIH